MFLPQIIIFLKVQGGRDFIYLFYLLTTRGMWNLSSLTKGWMHASCIGSMES